MSSGRADRRPPGSSWSAPPGRLPTPAGRAGDSVARPSVISPAARKAIRQRMLFLRSASLARLQQLTGVSGETLARYRQELRASDLPDVLLGRGAGLAFAHELPQGALLYLLVRAAAPQRVVETGVRPGYTTAWILAALEANGAGELVSLGPGTSAGRSNAVQQVSVGQFVPPGLRARWTLALGNSEEHLREILTGGPSIDLFLYDNGPDPARARFELRAAWDALSGRGILLAHRIDAGSAWHEFCDRQGVPAQVFDPGPPPMGALAVRPRGP